MSHPFFDAISFPWDRKDARELHDALSQAIQDAAKTRLCYERSKESLPPLADGDPQNMWKEALGNLVLAQAFQQFCDLLVADGNVSAIHPFVQAVIDSEDSPGGDSPEADEACSEQELAEADEKARGLLLQYAKEIIEEAKLTGAVCDFFNIEPPKVEDAALVLLPAEDDEEEETSIPDALMNLVLFVRDSESTDKVEHPTLIRLRDVAICLSLPRSHRLAALRQVLIYSEVVKLPTNDMKLAQSIVSRCIGSIPQLGSEEERESIRQRALRRGEKLVVDSMDAIVGSRADLSGPGETGLSEQRYLAAFCAGLAEDLGVEVDFEWNSEKVSETSLSSLRSAIDLFVDRMKVQIIVFLSGERTPNEIKTLQEWFPNLGYYRVADTQPKELGDLAFQIKIFDELMQQTKRPN